MVVNVHYTAAQCTECRLQILLFVVSRPSRYSCCSLYPGPAATVVVRCIQAQQIQLLLLIVSRPSRYCCCSLYPGPADTVVAAHCVQAQPLLLLFVVSRPSRYSCCCSLCPGPAATVVVRCIQAQQIQLLLLIVSRPSCYCCCLLYPGPADTVVAAHCVQAQLLLLLFVVSRPSRYCCCSLYPGPADTVVGAHWIQALQLQLLPFVVSRPSRCRWWCGCCSTSCWFNSTSTCTASTTLSQTRDTTRPLSTSWHLKTCLGHDARTHGCQTPRHQVGHGVVGPNNLPIINCWLPQGNKFMRNLLLLIQRFGNLVHYTRLQFTCFILTTSQWWICAWIVSGQ